MSYKKCIPGVGWVDMPGDHPSAGKLRPRLTAAPRPAPVPKPNLAVAKARLDKLNQQLADLGVPPRPRR